MAAAFSLLDFPGFLLAFGAENPFGDGGTLLLGVQVAVNVEAVTVPEPSSLVLLLGGIMLLIPFGRRRLQTVGLDRLS